MNPSKDEIAVIRRERAAFVEGVKWANTPRSIGFRGEPAAKERYPIIREEENAVLDPNGSFQWAFIDGGLCHRWFQYGAELQGHWIPRPESTLMKLWIPTPARVKVWVEVMEQPTKRVVE